MGLLGFSGSGFAQHDDHSFSIYELNDAAKVALETFERMSPESFPSVFGIQSVLSNQNANVKLYLKGDQGTIQVKYECHKHGREIECHNLDE